MYDTVFDTVFVELYFRMGCVFFQNVMGLTLKFYDCIPPGDDFDYLRPNGTLAISTDRCSCF